MYRRGWVGWVEDNRLLAAGLALCLVMSSVGFGTLIARSTDDDDQEVAAVSPSDLRGNQTFDDTIPGETTTTLAGAAAALTTLPGPRVTRRGPAAGETVGAPKPTANVIPGTKALPPCAPAKDYKAIGIDSTQVTVGEIITDVNALPAQLYPVHEGLRAYVNLINAAGGVCGRKINIEYQNDQLNPAVHDYQSLANKVFAFVGTSSLLDQNDYEATPPFNPRYKSGGEYVPDIGGFAYSYPRNQSSWFAGVTGSLSPVLVGGGPLKMYQERLKAERKPCTKVGLVFLNEPTGASSDQSSLGEVSVAEPWGMGLGPGKSKKYERQLIDPIPVYEGMVQQMVADGMNCVITYADLGSNVNLVRAMKNQGVWPPSQCTLGPRCFRLVVVPFAAYDPKFIRDSQGAAEEVQTFLPHLPLNETSGAAMQSYLTALKGVKDAEPGTFSMIGFASGHLFVEAIGNCGSAPTRGCVMDYLRKLKGFDAGGLFGPNTPFRTTRVRCGDCGSFTWDGVFDWKWIFNCNVSVRVQGGDFRRNGPPGFACDELHIARGSPG